MKIIKLKVVKDNMKLQDVSLKKLKEIALVALTYRVSFKTLAKMFGTTIEDVDISCSYLDNLELPLYYLKVETQNENEEFEKIAEKNARLYFQKRNKLYERLKKEPEKKTEILKQITDLYHTIDDYEISRLLNKKAFTFDEFEQEIVAKYRLKYYCSLRRTQKNLGIDVDFIVKFEEILAKKDPIYARKLDLLNYTYDLKRNEFARANPKRR